MKLIQYTDEKGYLKQSLIKSNMPASQASAGIPYNPPDLSQLDWNAIAIELNRMLIEQELISMADLSKNTLPNTILRAIQPKIVGLYKEQAYAKSENGFDNEKPITIKE